MGNKEIAKQFSLLAALLELHGENAFKTKAYANAYLALRKWDTPLAEMADNEIASIPGLGSSVVAKIREILTTGTMDALEKVKAKTPDGIQQLLGVKGLGPKKVRQIWDELKVESPAELLYAINENRLVSLQGFGLKTQEDLRQKIAYYLESEHLLLYGQIEEELNGWLEWLRKKFPTHRFEWAGEMARKCPVIISIEVLTDRPLDSNSLTALDGISIKSYDENVALVEWNERFSIRIRFANGKEFEAAWYSHTLPEELFQMWKDNDVVRGKLKSLPLEMLDHPDVLHCDVADIITDNDLHGILHNHSTWSDGIHTLKEMAEAVRDKGYAYFAICDHSRSAFYANGLSAERVIEQAIEIDALNAAMAPFRIFKGIEADILGDGNLDYEEDVLRHFDLIVASIHSNLRMDEDKAMRRLLSAIENPYTDILGHPTGRLLLARKGYPIDHKKIIDACAANGVAIELNANPLRLDIDYSWIPYCMEKNVMISINPDAHSRGQLDYTRYGVIAARKGGLQKRYCLNALSAEEFERWRSGRKNFIV